jgi:NAD(P)-dependent dehydrogenase (short-subunit alcohol dehydrogenase family)
VAESLSTEALYVQGDVSTKEGCDDLVAKSLEKFGRLDYLVNNAGMNMGAVPHSDLDAVDEDAMRKVFDVNMFGVFYMCRAAMPSLKASGNGCIINVTSVAGVRPGGSSIPYSMSKAAVNHLYARAAVDRHHHHHALRLVAPAADHPRLCRSSLATPPSCLLPPASCPLLAGRCCWRRHMGRRSA